MNILNEFLQFTHTCACFATQKELGRNILTENLISVKGLILSYVCLLYGGKVEMVALLPPPLSCGPSTTYTPSSSRDGLGVTRVDHGQVCESRLVCHQFSLMFLILHPVSFVTVLPAHGSDTQRKSQRYCYAVPTRAKIPGLKE